MLKKGFYDILTLIFAILILFTLYFQYVSFQKNQDIIFNCYLEGHYGGEELENCLLGDGFSISTEILKLIAYSLMFIYWLFIFVLAIKLHKRDLTKTIDVVVIAILPPLAIIFYLTNLRKSLKKYRYLRN